MPHVVALYRYPLKGFTQNADLTRVPGRSGRAAGQVIDVMGRVLNLKGEPVRNAKVEIWQANARGRYTHPSDTNPAPLDPNFDELLAMDASSAIVVALAFAPALARKTGTRVNGAGLRAW